MSRPDIGIAGVGTRPRRDGAAAPAPMNVGIVGVGTRHRGATALPRPRTQS